jgi:predicted transposase/invertase (TIGR01784 family)
MTDIPKELQGDVIAKAFEKAEFIKLPKVEQDKYHQNLKVYRDLVNSYTTAHKTGRKEGIKEGIEQGVLQEKVEIAKNLLKSGISIDVIIKTTGLSFEEIEGLE